jgi:hypothetical protein
MSKASDPGVDLTGLIDIHIHTAPDIRPRFADDIDMVRSASEAGLRAVMIKSHVTPTADRATIAEKVVGGIRVFGGLVLNEPVGGLNPAAVEVAIAMGAREIWMPTLDAANHRREHGQSGGLALFGEDGSLKPVVYEIIDLIRKADAILGTGHLSTEETVALVRAARDRGHQKILVTHPEASFVRMPASVQSEIAGPGVYFERDFVDTTPKQGALTVACIAERIREVGVETTVLATDFGQSYNVAPVEGFRAYLAGLLAEGFTWQRLQRMAGENPAYLLGI